MKIPVTIGVCGETVWDAAPEGVLTDEHAACSYGQPVVLIDGVPHGPGDLRGEVVSPHYGLSLLPHTPRPGDAPEYYRPTDEELRARRDPEWVELARRAQAAGYKVNV